MVALIILLLICEWIIGNWGMELWKVALIVNSGRKEEAVVVVEGGG